MFSELIWEYGDDNEPDWVHVAYLKGDTRKMVKRAIRLDNGLVSDSVNYPICFSWKNTPKGVLRLYLV